MAVASAVCDVTNPNETGSDQDADAYLYDPEDDPEARELEQQRLDEALREAGFDPAEYDAYEHWLATRSP